MTRRGVSARAAVCSIACLLVLFLPRAAPAADLTIEQRLSALRREAESRHPPSAEAFASRLTALGRELLERGDVPEAIELFSEAVGRDPNNGTAVAELILGYLENGDLEFADFYLDQAVSNPAAKASSPAVYRTIGDAFAARHRMDEALVAWEQFRRLGGSDPAIDEKIDRARGELSIRQPQRVWSSDRLIVYTDASIPPEVATRIEEHLSGEIDRLRQFFPTEEALGPEIVIVYEGRAYFSLVSIPNWVSGVFDGKIRVSLEYPARWRPELAAVLSHELTHAYLRGVSRGRAPAWLHEGLAQWFQGERIPSADLRSFFSRRKVRSLDELESVLSRRPDRESTRDVYVEALGLVEHLVDERGIGTLGCIVKDLGSGRSMDEALIRETGWSSAELVARWKKAIRLGAG